MTIQRKLNERERMAYASIARLEQERDALAAQRNEGLAREAELQKENRILRHEVASFLETLSETCDMLGIDLDAAKTAPGKPSDVLHSHAKALQQRLDEAEKDAARYRFLRDGDRGGVEYWDDELCVCEPEDALFGKALDARVDSSIAVLAERIASPGCADGEEAE